MNETLQRLKQEIAKVVVGQEEMIDALLIALLCEGHVLLESVPGLAKTTTVNTLAKSLDLLFRRVQFTPDLLPGDIVGLQMYDRRRNDFYIKKGPVFANLLLADEINRAPAKVQSALLEAMQEHQVTIGEESFPLPSPFVVLATQNPLEQEGVYPLPEAQLDRFMLKIHVGYGTKDQELMIARRISSQGCEPIEAVATAKDLAQMKKDVQAVYIDAPVERYMIDLVFATRDLASVGLHEYDSMIAFGASPRASIDLFKCAKARAYLDGSTVVTPVSVAKIAKDVLRHRVTLSYEAVASDVTVDQILDRILSAVPLP